MDNGESSYRRFLAGNNEGMLEIVDEYQTGLMLYINSFVQNIHMAEDLSEDTFYELMIKRPKFSGKSSFKTWLYAIGRNITAKHILYIRSVPLTIERSIPSIHDILFFIFTAPFVWCDFSISYRKRLVQCEKLITDYRKMLYHCYLKTEGTHAILIK